MSERGVFAVDRGIWDHPSLCSDAPFSNREAWLWLLSEAAWKPHRKRVGSVVVDVGRGQLAHSYRFLAERWKWSLGKVQRFLRRLETDTMLATQSDTGLLRITICNYDRYQRVSLPSDTLADTPAGTAAIQQRYKLEDKEDKEVSSETSSLRSRAKPRKHPWPADYGEQFWRLYPKHTDKKPAVAALDREHAKDRTPWDAIVAGIEAMISHVDPQFHPAPHRWLRDERWNDEHRPRGRAPPGRNSKMTNADLARDFAERIRAKQDGQPPHDPSEVSGTGTSQRRDASSDAPLFERSGLERERAGPIIDLVPTRSERH